MIFVDAVINCGDPGTPVNGRRQVSSTAFRSAVHYSCNGGFSLVGDVVRICMASGEWSGFIPTCKSKSNTFRPTVCVILLCIEQVVGCENPGVPINGHSDYRDNKIGSVVTHSCVAGFELKGDHLRQCLPSGVWSGSLPTCQRKQLLRCCDTFCSCMKIIL